MEADIRFGNYMGHLEGIILLHRLGRKIFFLAILGLFFLYLLQTTFFLKLLYPFPYREPILKYSETYEVNCYLVLALIRTESRFRPQATSRAGARGLMQIMPETGEWIACQLGIEDYRAEDLYLPERNIQMGIWYISYLDRVFQGELGKVLAAYNAGEQKVKKWLAEKTWSGRLQDVEQIPYQETRSFIDKVLFSYHIYKRIY